MPTEAVVLFVALAGSFGTLAVIAVGARCTRNLHALGWGGICSGAALALLAYCSLRWITHGFEPLQVWVLPLACLVLLLVMLAQNWFVFYEDRGDLAQSARPTLVVLSAAAALALAAGLGTWRSSAQSIIAASALSAILVLAIHPVRRSIAANGSVIVGVLVGIAKLLVPSTGVVVLLLIDRVAHSLRQAPAGRPPPEHRARGEQRGPVGAQSFLIEMLLLMWDLGQLLLAALVNGARYVPHRGLAASSPLAAAHERRDSAVGPMPLSKRNSAVLMLVVAVHLLCGLLLIRN